MRRHADAINDVGTGGVVEALEGEIATLRGHIQVLEAEIDRLGEQAEVLEALRAEHEAEVAQ